MFRTGDLGCCVLRRRGTGGASAGAGGEAKDDRLLLYRGRADRQVCSNFPPLIPSLAGAHAYLCRVLSRAMCCVQVKIRGVRVELAAVEGVLLKAPGPLNMAEFAMLSPPTLVCCCDLCAGVSQLAVLFAPLTPRGDPVYESGVVYCIFPQSPCCACHQIGGRRRSEQWRQHSSRSHRALPERVRGTDADSGAATIRLGASAA